MNTDTAENKTSWFLYFCSIISKKENKYGKVLITVKARNKIWIFIVLFYFSIYLNSFLNEKNGTKI